MENEDVGSFKRDGRLRTRKTVLTRVKEDFFVVPHALRTVRAMRRGVILCFNGTAEFGEKCIVDSGGWNFRTTVEDVDLSLRAYLKGGSLSF